MDELTAKDVQRIKNGVTLRSPYYASLLLELELAADSSIQTASVDGVTLRYNPAYISSLPFNVRIGVFAHEADHCGRNHHTRMGDRDPKLFNIAADYSTNGELLRDGFQLPDGCLIDARFTGMSAERIYNILDKEREKEADNDQPGQGGKEKGQQGGKGQPDPSQPGNGQPDPQGQPDPSQGNQPGDLDVGGCGSFTAPSGQDGQAMSQPELGRERARWDSIVDMAERVTKRIGNAAGSAVTTIREQQAGTADWREELREFMYRCVDQRYSWLSGDRRFAHAGIWMPNRESKRLGEILIGVDTSSSVSQRQLRIVKDECNQMFHEVNPQRVHVVFWDAIVQRAVTYEDDEYPIEFSFPGRGGTQVQSFFNWIERHDITPACVLCFSDLEIGDWGEEPDFPILWGDLKGRHTAPYGVQIDLSGI